MTVLLVTVFVSLLLVVAGVLLFVWRLRAGDFDHGERLSLLPLADDRPAAAAAVRGPADRRARDPESEEERGDRQGP